MLDALIIPAVRSSNLFCTDPVNSFVPGPPNEGWVQHQG